MPIAITLKDVAPPASQRRANVLDADQVLVRFCTQHDNRVRPSHAALDGKVFRLDDPGRPSPPLDYGCRCFLEYVAVEDTMAERVLPVAEEEPTTPPAAYADYLDERIGRAVWSRIRREVDDLKPLKRLDAAFHAVIRTLPKKQRGDARELARMIVEAALKRARKG